MGFIDLNIKKPAWKRTEVDEETAAAADETPEAETKSRSGVRRTARVTAGVAAVAVSLLTLRRLRRRRRNRNEAVDESDE